MNAVLRESEKKQRAMQDNQRDTSFYVELIFQSREQRDAFNKGVGLKHLDDGRFADGRIVARNLGIVIPHGLAAKVQPKMIGKRFADMVRPRTPSPTTKE